MSWVTGYIAGHYALRPQPFYLGIAIAVIGLLMSHPGDPRDTRPRRTSESRRHRGAPESRAPSLGRIFYVTSLGNVSLFAACQAGLVNNLNDGMSWGLYPLFFAALGLGVQRIGVVKAVYPVVWGLLQIGDRAAVRPLRPEGADRVGHDRPGRRDLAHRPRADLRASGSSAAALQGLGTAMVYPTLLAAITDHAHPTWRASSLGVYRFWRDLGYAVGALLSGLVADLVGLEAAIHLVAVLTLASGLVVARVMGTPAPVSRPA